MGSSVDRELDLEESHGRIAVVNDDENIRKQEEESFCTALQLVPTENAIVEGGRPFKRAHGLHLFEYTGSDPRFHQAFHTAMFNYAIIVMKKILQIYKGFEQLNKLVDVGGGLGHTLNLIISKYPHIKGINYDMPQVIKHVSPNPGVECVGGDMFESVPKGDAIIMKMRSA